MKSPARSARNPLSIKSFVTDFPDVATLIQQLCRTATQRIGLLIRFRGKRQLYMDIPILSPPVGHFDDDAIVPLPNLSSISV